MSYGPPPSPGVGYAVAPVPRPPLPQTVQIAFWLMLGGAVMQVLGLIITVVRISALRDEFRTRFAQNGTTPSESSLDAIVTVTIVFASVFALIGVGLWIWMAFANRAGRAWARITGTVFFGVYTLSMLSSVAVSAGGGANQFNAGGGDPVSLLISGVAWAMGLAVVILLWNRASGAFFRPVHVPGPGGYPYGQVPVVQPQAIGGVQAQWPQLAQEQQQALGGAQAQWPYPGAEQSPYPGQGQPPYPLPGQSAYPVQGPPPPAVPGPPPAVQGPPPPAVEPPPPGAPPGEGPPPAAPNWTGPA